MQRLLQAGLQIPILHALRLAWNCKLLETAGLFVLHLPLCTLAPQQLLAEAIRPCAEPLITQHHITYRSHQSRKSLQPVGRVVVCFLVDLSRGFWRAFRYRQDTQLRATLSWWTYVSGSPIACMGEGDGPCCLARTWSRRSLLLLCRIGFAAGYW